MEHTHIFRIKLLLFALWATGVLWYFSQRFPLVHLPEIMLNGLMLMLLFLFFTALGKRMLAGLHIPWTSWLEECCFSFGIGSGVMMLVVFGFAAVGLLYKPLITSLVAGGAILVYKDARAICMQGYRILSGYSFREKSAIELILLLFMGTAVIITFVTAATPPVFYDALVYHLAVPAKYLLRHGFHAIPHNHNATFPSNLGMLFIVAMSFAGEMLAQLLSWLYAPLSALAVYMFARPRWGNGAALFAAAILWLVPGILVASLITTIDSGVMFYSFLSVAALLAWFESHQRYWFILSGILCGIALGIKYPAMVVTFAPLELLLFLHSYVSEKRSLVVTLRRMIGFGLIVLCVIAPWFLKNWVYTGNPIYPFFQSFFGARGSQILDYQQYLRNANSFFPPGQVRTWFEVVWVYLTTPWRVTMGTYGEAGKAGVIFLLCLPGIVLLKRTDRNLRGLLISAGCAYWLWVFLLPATLRYVFPMFPPLSLIAGYILWNLPLSVRRRTWLFGGITLILAYNFVFLFAATLDLKPFPYLLGNQTKEEFLVTHGITYYPAVQYVNANIPSSAKILFIGETRGSYWERDYLLYAVPFVGVFDDQEMPLRKEIVESQDVAEVLQKLQAMGVTHILVNQLEMKRLMGGSSARKSYFNLQAEKDQNILQRLFSPQYLRLLFTQYEVYLYEILYSQTHQRNTSRE